MASEFNDLVAEIDGLVSGFEFLSWENDTKEEVIVDGCCCSSEPHYAMVLVLGYLDLKDLLSVEMVCRSLNCAVKNDPSLWMNITVEHPLDKKLTDDALFKLTSRASGLLKSLTLVWCCWITDSAIKPILDANPFLTKLSVPGCFGLSIEGLLAALEHVGAALSVKQLRVAGFSSAATALEYEELKVLLGVADADTRPPLYIHRIRSRILVNDDRALDIDKCPVCDHVALVFDCPAESCRKSEEECRGCFLCVYRCIYCGCCLSDDSYVDTGHEAICARCWDRVYRCQLPSRWA